MIVHIRSEKIESIQVATIDELRMVLEAYGEIPPAQQPQQQIPQVENELEQIAIKNPQPTAQISQRSILKDRLKQFYNSLENGTNHQRALQALAKSESGIVNKDLGVILGIKRNQSVASLMSSISRNAKKVELFYKDIMTSENIVTPTGRVQVYHLSELMQEAMKELGFTPQKDEKVIMKDHPFFNTTTQNTHDEFLSNNA